MHCCRHTSLLSLLSIDFPLLSLGSWTFCCLVPLCGGTSPSSNSGSGLFFFGSWSVCNPRSIGGRGLAKHSCLNLVLTFRILDMCGAHASLLGMLSHEQPAKTLQSSICLESSHYLSHTQPLQLNPTLNIGYKRLNRITIKFVAELEPTKHIVVNYKFTISPFGYSMTKPLKQTLDLNVNLGTVEKLTHT